MNVLENLDILSVAIAVAGTLILGFTVFFSDKKSITNKTFLLFCIITSIWGIVNFFGYRVTNSILSLMFLRIVMLLAVLQAYFIFQFFYVFPKKEIKFSSLYKYIFLPIVFIVAIISATPLVLYKIGDISNNGQIIKIINGPAVPLFGIVSIVLVLAAIFIFIKKLTKVKDTTFKGYVEILIGIILMFGFIITFNFILPALFNNSSYLPFGALFTFPFVVLTSYAIFHNKLLNVKVVSTAILVFLLSIILFLEIIFAESTDIMMFRVGVFLLVLIIGINLIKSVLKEVEQKEELAKLNLDLKGLLKQRESLVHLVTHKVKGSFTRSKYIFAGMLDGMFGELSEEVRKRAQQGLESDNMGIQTVDLVLNAANLENGIIKYDMSKLDLKNIVESVIYDKKISIEKKGLDIKIDIKDEEYYVYGDSIWLKEVFNNLVENSIQYTKEGSLTIGLLRKEKKILFYIKDTGVGITIEDKKNLFTEGGRGKDSVKINVDSTGYGLYSVKLIVDAHKGSVWVESLGLGKGSTFFVELDAV